MAISHIGEGEVDYFVGLPIAPDLTQAHALMLALGIDTGGTYTDAVVFDHARGVIASAKALTSRHDLAVGITEALDTVLAAAGPDHPAASIGLVSLSTTLATNAVVEGRHAPVCLLLVGQGPEALSRAGLGRALAGDPVVYISGGHDAAGIEREALDAAAVRAAVADHAPRVSAFAIASYFAVRNAAHECTVRDLVHAGCDLPVTCSHELSSGLDAPRRAMTAVLNARLVPLIRGLIDAVRTTLAARGIDAPLMLVRGDGSLLAADQVRLRPVETILSGPAASVVGAHYLCGLDDAVVSDIGGTTTDVALLREGRPAISPRGATVGGWRTMVEAVEVFTFGLGGDSEVHRDDQARLSVGPRRVVPLALLGRDHRACIDTLASQAERPPAEYPGRFALRAPGPASASGLTRLERRLLDDLADGPRALSGWIESRVTEAALVRLARRELVWLAGLTPSDAAHVLGYQSNWSAAAAGLGMLLWSRLGGNGDDEEEPEALARAVVAALVQASARAITEAALASERDPDAEVGSPPAVSTLLAAQPLARAFETRPAAHDRRLVEVNVALLRPLIGIGAPAAVYYPAIAERLNAALHVPPQAGVCNAIGAVAGSVIQRARIVITAPEEGRFRVHMMSGVKDFPTLEEAASAAQDEASRSARAQAAAGGASAITVHVRRDDNVVEGAGGLRVFVESVVEATASGRPAFAAGKVE